MSVSRLDPLRASVKLPEPAALDGLDATALVVIAEQAAALQAGAIARLTQIGTTPSPTVDADEHWTAKKVAQFLKAEPAWVYRHARQLGGVKLDGVLRFSRRRLLAYIERQHRIGS